MTSIRTIAIRIALASALAAGAVLAGAAATHHTESTSRGALVTVVRPGEIVHCCE